MVDITVVLVLVISASLNPVSGDEECKLPNSKVQNFDLSKFQGLWHVVSSDKEQFSKGYKCWNDTFIKDGDNVSLESHYIGLDGAKKEGSRKIQFHGDSPSYKAESGDPAFNIFNGEFLILATDYTDYAIMAACTASIKNLYYVLCREIESNNKQQTPDAVKKALKSLALDVNKFIPIGGTS